MSALAVVRLKSLFKETLMCFCKIFETGSTRLDYLHSNSDSVSTDERQAWRAIRKELEDNRISVAAFDANKGFIVNCFKTPISTGAFEEPAEDGPSSEDDFSQYLEDQRHDTVLCQPWEDVWHDTVG